LKEDHEMLEAFKHNNAFNWEERREKRRNSGTITEAWEAPRAGKRLGSVVKQASSGTKDIMLLKVMRQDRSTLLDTLGDMEPYTNFTML
jgi:hypothetical protein